jgi:hypothetical protein
MKTGKEFIEFSPKHKKKKNILDKQIKNFNKIYKIKFFLEIKIPFN